MRPALVMCAAILLGGAASATGQALSPQATSRVELHDAIPFLTGAAFGFAVHESGHLLFDYAFDAHPTIQSVRFGPVPFFAIAPRGELRSWQYFTIASMGFWTQVASSEWLLTTRPALRDEHAPFAKGLLAFDVLTSVGYAIVGAFEAGPPQRDTSGMAVGSGLDERAIAAIVAAPAVLDAYRYLRPDARWPVWLSRATKIGSVLLVFKSRSGTVVSN